MTISIVIPSYNEMRNLKAGVLDRVYTYLTTQKLFNWELILTDDGSTDGTLEGIKNFAKGKSKTKVLSNPHRGKGPTVIAGLLESVGEYALFTDFDQATPLSEIEKLLPFVDKKYDIVIGSREIQGAKRQREPFHRHLMGKGFNFAVSLVAIRGIHDTQCGFKLFSRASIKKLAPKLVVYSGKSKQDAAFMGAFDVELLFLANKFGFSIAEVPIIWTYVKTNRVSPIKDSAKMFFDILRIRLADLRGAYA